MVNLFPLIKDYLVDKDDGIRQLITWFLNLVMEEEALLQAGAQRYERTDSRKASRNGYKPRTLLTKYGELELLKPQFREFPFETQVFEKYSRVEKAILTAVAESYLQGISTRRMEKIMTALGVGKISASSVSRITKELDEKVEEFLSKTIEHEIPYLLIDATYFKVRDGLMSRLLHPLFARAPWSSMPAVSIQSTGPSGSNSIGFSTGSVVVPAISETIETSCRVIAFNSDDLPALRRPNRPMCRRRPLGAVLIRLSLGWRSWQTIPPFLRVLARCERPRRW